MKSGRRVPKPRRRDLNIFNVVGIPVATFGMSRKSASDAPERFVEIRILLVPPRCMRWELEIFADRSISKARDRSVVRLLKILEG